MYIVITKLSALELDEVRLTKISEDLVGYINANNIEVFDFDAPLTFAEKFNNVRQAIDFLEIKAKEQLKAEVSGKKANPMETITIVEIDGEIYAVNADNKVNDIVKKAKDLANAGMSQMFSKANDIRKWAFVFRK